VLSKPDPWIKERETCCARLIEFHSFASGSSDELFTTIIKIDEPLLEKE
jgi:hypothetical protein